MEGRQCRELIGRSDSKLMLARRAVRRDFESALHLVFDPTAVRESDRWLQTGERLDLNRPKTGRRKDHLARLFQPAALNRHFDGRTSLRNTGRNSFDMLEQSLGGNGSYRHQRKHCNDQPDS
jgi:hypothetical protein